MMTMAEILELKRENDQSREDAKLSKLRYQKITDDINQMSFTIVNYNRFIIAPLVSGLV